MEEESMGGSGGATMDDKPMGEGSGGMDDEAMP
jgi:hypothetical protein